MPIAFAGARIDRADHIRSDPEALAALHPSGRLLRMEGLDPVLTQDGQLAWDDMPQAGGEDELIFLGIDPEGGAVARFARVPLATQDGVLFAGPRSWQAMSVLPADQLAIYGAARALVNWHSRHRFCAISGHPTRIDKGGWQRTCTDPACNAEHFPRTDPVTIMLIEHDGKVLLGRQPRFPAGRYSTLAGFVEPGETIEESVAREVFEEAGLRVRDVTYVASQPWPFPSSLMIGCHGHTDDDTITVDRTELDDARWFSREDVADAIAAADEGGMGRAFGAPPVTAIANVLMRSWLQRS